MDDLPARREQRPSGLDLNLGPLVERFRYFVLIPVVVLLLSSLGAFVYSAALFVHSAVEIGDHAFPVGKNIALFVLVIDLSLVGATLLIAAIGLYELFLGEVATSEQSTRLRGWLVMNDLNDLKARVISMIVLVAAVSFIEVVVDFHAGVDVLYLGGAIGLVVVALTFFLRFGNKEHEPLS